MEILIKSIMIKPGVYCSVTKQEVEEMHGGVKLKSFFHHHICFYNEEKLVGFYGGSQFWLKPFLDRDFRYSGEITRADGDQIDFYINDPAHNDKFLFTGTHHDKQLELVGRRASKPEDIWLEDAFEFIGTGEI